MKQTNISEPVAWISPRGSIYKTRFQAVQNFEQVVEPLYTEPKDQTELLKQALEALEQIASAMPFPVVRGVIKEIKQHLGEA